MNYISFNEWLVQERKDIFGFEKKKEIISQKEDDQPISMLDGGLIIKDLMHRKLGLKEPTQNFNDEITWGNPDHGEAIRVDLSPLGSLRAITRMFTRDLDGKGTWICKAVLPLPDDHYNKRELHVSDYIFKFIEKINKTGTDSASKEFEMERFAIKLGTEIKFQKPCKWMVFEKIKKIKENHYLILLNMTGNGQENSGGSGLSSKIMQYQIQLYFDKDRGLLRCFGNAMQSSKKTVSWTPTPPDWDEYFAPSQSKEEITRCIIKSLETY